MESCHCAGDLLAIETTPSPPVIGTTLDLSLTTLQLRSALIKSGMGGPDVKDELMNIGLGLV